MRSKEIARELFEAIDDVENFLFKFIEENQASKGSSPFIEDFCASFDLDDTNRFNKFYDDYFTYLDTKEMADYISKIKTIPEKRTIKDKSLTFLEEYLEKQNNNAELFITSYYNGRDNHLKKQKLNSSETLFKPNELNEKNEQSQTLAA